jgi:hypothetical protein
LQPLQNDRRIEAAGIGEDDFLDAFFLGHDRLLRKDLSSHNGSGTLTDIVGFASDACSDLFVS